MDMVTVTAKTVEEAVTKALIAVSYTHLYKNEINKFSPGYGCYLRSGCGSFCHCYFKNIKAGGCDEACDSGAQTIKYMIDLFVVTEFFQGF